MQWSRSTSWVVLLALVTFRGGAAASASKAASPPANLVSPVHLEWEELTCTVSSNVMGTKTILSKVTGKADPGRLLAILGPSGSGKTTLLNVLANQVPESKSMGLSGRLMVNGLKKKDEDGEYSHTQAYIRQQDLFYSQLSVRETLLMAARLRLPDTLNLKEKYDECEALLVRMGLGKVADTIVGDEKVRGISGGEKKRLSLACELIGKPSVIFADEPTSGLDAFQAEILMKSLRNLAETGGHTVVVSIHQPRSSIFQLFHDVCLMSEGEMVYNGPAEGMIAYFTERGHVCPKAFNPAEFALDLVSVDFTNKDTEDVSRERVKRLVDDWKAKRAPLLIDSMRKRRPGLIKSSSLVARPNIRGPTRMEQFKLLFKRSWRQITRNKGANVARAMSNVFSAVVFGFLFFQMGDGQTSVQDRMGLLQVAAINVAMSSLIKTITVFVKERLIVSRERSSGKGSSYGAGPYFLSKLAAELPVTAAFPVLFGAIMYPLAGLQGSASKFLTFLGILIVESYAAAGLGMAVGCIVPSVDAGLAVAPAVMVLFIIMGGYYVNQNSVPAAFRWLQDVSLIKYAFEALCCNEFSGLKFNPEGATQAAFTTGEQVLKRLSFQDSSVLKAVGSQSFLALSTWLITYALLALKKPKYQAVIDPDDAKKAAEGDEEGDPTKVDASSSSSSSGAVQSASILRLSPSSASAPRPRGPRVTMWSYSVSPSNLRTSQPKIFL